MTATPTPAMDDTPTVPRPPGAVEAVARVLWLHDEYDLDADPGSRTAHELRPEYLARAQALVDAGCVLGDDWVVETVEQWGVRPAGVAPDAALFANRVAAELVVEGAHRTLVTRTVTTATRTTAWKEAE